VPQTNVIIEIRPVLLFTLNLARILHIISRKSWYCMQTKSWWWAIREIRMYLISRNFMLAKYTRFTVYCLRNDTLFVERDIKFCSLTVMLCVTVYAGHWNAMLTIMLVLLTICWLKDCYGNAVRWKLLLSQNSLLQRHCHGVILLYLVLFIWHFSSQYVNILVFLRLMLTITTSSPALAEKPRCRVCQFWPKFTW